MMTAMAGQKKTLYEILGITQDANSLDIGLAYQRRTAELNRAVPQDPHAMAFVHQAHEVLANPARRAAYDASLITAAEKAAAAGQATDLVLEGGEEEEKPRHKRFIPLIGAAVAILVILIFVLRGGKAPEAPKIEPVVEAPKPAPPHPPPVALGAHQILPAALLSVGRVMSYEMSGRAVPVGLAIAVEPGAMVTTCHGIGGNSQMVVRYGAESLSANLSATDEVLDLCKLAVTGMNARAIEIAADEAKANDRIFVLGANAAGQFALTEGTVKATRIASGVKVLELSVPIAATASGGAVFDVYGRLVGIATTPHRYGANVNAAISSAWISQMRTRGRPQQ
jgi:S1-C subfamily serine protease